MNRAEFSETCGALLVSLLRTAETLEGAGLLAAGTAIREHGATMVGEVLSLAPPPTADEENEARAEVAASVLSNHPADTAWIGRSLARVAFATTAAEVDKIVTESIEAKLAGIDW